MNPYPFELLDPEVKINIFNFEKIKRQIRHLKNLYFLLFFLKKLKSNSEPENPDSNFVGNAGY